MKKIMMLGHAGSGNHGSEAIIKGTRKIFDEYKINLPLTVETKRPEEDLKYGTIKNNEYIRYSENKFIELSNKISNKLIKHPTSAYKVISKKMFNDIDEQTLCMVIGGDTYCYRPPYRMYYYNKKAREKGARTVLWGCSISEEKITKEMEEDLKSYNLISVRESLSYESLKNHGIIDNVVLHPDPAFQLDKVELELPYNFKQGNTIGINISPMIISYEKKKGQTLLNYIELIKYILNTTDSNIALIPHVVWKHTDDRKVLKDLYERFKKTNRVALLGDYNSEELKGFISRCRMFIGARTHATIAAYSTNVPTLVIGYSIKAKGIAKDIFGTYDNYVIPVQNLMNKKDLINAFEWLKENEEKMRRHLEKVMPEYKKKSLEAGEEILKLIN